MNRQKTRRHGPASRRYRAGQTEAVPARMVRNRRSRTPQDCRQEIACRVPCIPSTEAMVPATGAASCQAGRQRPLRPAPCPMGSEPECASTQAQARKDVSRWVHPAATTVRTPSQPMQFIDLQMPFWSDSVELWRNIADQLMHRKVFKIRFLQRVKDGFNPYRRSDTLITLLQPEPPTSGLVPSWIPLPAPD